MAKYLPLFLLCALFSCRGTGQLDHDFSKALQRVEGQQRPGKRRLANLFEAFDAAQSEDYLRARQLDSIEDPAKWPEAHALYAAMHDRLAPVENYFPLGAKTNYRGGYSLTELATRTENARLAAGDYYLTLADATTGAARTGSKPAARTAYSYYQEVFYYLPERRRELAVTSDEMRDLGTVRIYLNLTGDREMLEPALDNRHLQVPTLDEWYEVYSRPTQKHIDYEATIEFVDYSDWGPSESSTCNTYSEEVLDYIEKKEYEERIDDSTVVKKIEEIEHFKTITATVTTIVQERSLSARGELWVAGSLESISGSKHWENTYSTCSGDADALPAFACSGSSSWPPSRSHLLEGAVDNLITEALDKLRWRYAPD